MKGKLTRKPRLHPKWGYDLDAVARVECLSCGKPIADEPYVELTTLARFGQMLFFHLRCDPDAKRDVPRPRRGRSRHRDRCGSEGRS